MIAMHLDRFLLSEEWNKDEIRIEPKILPRANCKEKVQWRGKLGREVLNDYMQHRESTNLGGLRNLSH